MYKSRYISSEFTSNFFSISSPLITRPSVAIREDFDFPVVFCGGGTNTCAIDCGMTLWSTRGFVRNDPQASHVLTLLFSFSPAEINIYRNFDLSRNVGYLDKILMVSVARKRTTNKLLQK
jgi:hypothetical protein